VSSLKYYNQLLPKHKHRHDLENLKHLLDPDRNDALLNKEKFLEIMNNWSHQLCSNSSPEQEFGSPTSRLSISAMHGNLSYKHSTPRHIRYVQQLTTFEQFVTYARSGSGMFIRQIAMHC